MAQQPQPQAEKKQRPRTVEPGYQTAPTVFGGTSTGLFNTLGTRTLQRGEVTFGVFWNNYDRNPGDLDINQIPVNFGVGLTDRWEVFFNVDFLQQVTTRQPFALSGVQFNGIRSAFGGDPFVAFGSPSGGRDDAPAAFFPFTGALAGGILPPPGFFFGTRFAASRPSFYNDLPFFGPAFFNAQTRGIDVRRSANGTGNVTVGTKINLIDPDHVFSLAIAGIVRIPTTRNYHGLANGRGTGEVDYGPVLILGQSLAGQRVRFSENIGYIRSGDPGKDGITVLDRRDQLLLNGGVEIAAHQKLVFVGELDGTVYVSSGTPSLNPVNPWDLVLGLRYFAWDGQFHLGAGYRRLLNGSAGQIPGSPSFQAISIPTGDVNGFVFSIGVGRRVERVPPPPPNNPPTVTLEADNTTVTDGAVVNLSARAADPDNDVLVYTWTKTAGEIVGSGSGVQLDTRGVNPTVGAPPVPVTVTVTVDDGRGGTASGSATITVNSPTPPPAPPPNRPPVIDSIDYAVVGTPQVPGQITDGENVRIRAVARDPDGDPLTYSWRASAGRLAVNGPEAILDTSGVTAGPGAPSVNITISLMVNDGHGGTDSDSRTLTVHSVKRPEAARLPDLEFPRRSARVNNVHKAILDDAVLRLRQEPQAVLVIDGHADKGESANIARRRAENVKNYLVREKGIDQNRIVVRGFGADRPHPSGDRRKNPRVELWIVPAGAEMPK
jgi:outer membrane protein OmpA-like peptidoglycan-associated protein